MLTALEQLSSGNSYSFAYDGADVAGRAGAFLSRG